MAQVGEGLVRDRTGDLGESLGEPSARAGRGLFER
jgi:hypothetical protein